MLIHYNPDEIKFNDLKNDTELQHEKVINLKLATLDNMLKLRIEKRNMQRVLQKKKEEI